MPVKRRIPKTRRAEIPQWQIDYLLTGERPADDAEGINQFAVLKFCHGTRGNAPAKDLWREIGAELVEEWVEARPGTRPYAWWLWDAPLEPKGRWPGWWDDGILPEPRARAGGKGDFYNRHSSHWFGLPVYWDPNWLIDYYNWVGRRPEDRGAWEQDYGPGHCKAQKFDPDDPPCFESEAAYLQRHRLLFEREGARLTAKDFDPETLPVEFWPYDVRERFTEKDTT